MATGFQTILNVQTPSQAGLDLLNPKILVVGEMLDAGTATSGELIENIISKTDAKAQFGATSPLYQAIDLGLSIFNPSGVSRFSGNYKAKLNAIGYKIASGTAGVRKIAISGTATDGKIKLHVGSQYRAEIEIDTVANESNATTAQKIIDAINAISNLPFTASLSTNDVLLTASMKGVWFNTVAPLTLSSVSLNTSGLTLAITTQTAGVGAIDISALFTTIQYKKFDYIIFNTSLLTSDLIASIQSRFNTFTTHNLSGIYVGCKTDSYADCLSFIETYKTKQAMGFICQNEANPTDFDLCHAMRYVAERAIKNATDTLIGDFTPNANATNSRGNISYKASAMSDNILLYHKVLPSSALFTQAQASALKDAGAILIENNDTNTVAIYGSDMSCYSETTQGETPLLKDIANFDTMAFVSGWVWSRAKAEYTGKTMTSGNAINLTQQINAQNVLAFCVEIYDILSSSDPETGVVYALLPNSSEAKALFLKGVEESLALNFASGKIEFVMNAIINGPLKTLLITMNYNK